MDITPDILSSNSGNGFVICDEIRKCISYGVMTIHFSFSSYISNKAIYTVRRNDLIKVTHGDFANPFQKNVTQTKSMHQGPLRDKVLEDQDDMSSLDSCSPQPMLEGVNSGSPRVALRKPFGNRTYGSPW